MTTEGWDRRISSSFSSSSSLTTGPNCVSADMGIVKGGGTHPFCCFFFPPFFFVFFLFVCVGGNGDGATSTHCTSPSFSINTCK